MEFLEANGTNDYDFLEFILQGIEDEKYNILCDYVDTYGVEWTLEQVLNGAEVESEHFDDYEVQIKIATDHLAESPLYYVALEEMENNLAEKTKAIRPYRKRAIGYWLKRMGFFGK